MTDIMKLADDYAECMYLRREKHEARAALQSAIEALQGENGQLHASLQSSRVAFEQVCKHRDALQAKLDAMGNGEPVGFVAPHDLKTLREGYPATVVMLPSNKRTEPLYAAPKALEPLTDCRIELVTAIHTLASHYENRLHRLDANDRKLAEGDIAHAIKIASKWNWNGITKGTPT